MLVTTNDITVRDWIMNSRASFNTTFRVVYNVLCKKRIGQVWLGNDFACDIKGISDIKLKFQNGTTFVLKDVCHVLELKKSLILIGQLDDEGYTCIYGENSWKISKGSLLVAKGTKSGSLSILHVISIKDRVICN